MIIKLSKEEEKNLVLTKAQNRQLSPDYIKERDKAWEDMVEEGEKRSKKFWNGSLYSFEGFSQLDMNHPIIYLGQMEYKDRLLKKKLGVENVVKKYGINHLLIHCGVGVVILTQDNKFVVGRKKMSVGLEKSLYAHVSGNLNIDEMEVNNIDDIYRFIIKEMQEEIGGEINKNNLKFTQINIFNSYCNFDFVYHMDINSEEVPKLPGSEEFESFEALSLEEILNLKVKGISDFEFSKRYLKELL